NQLQFYAILPAYLLQLNEGTMPFSFKLFFAPIRRTIAGAFANAFLAISGRKGVTGNQGRCWLLKQPAHFEGN
ncbi:MAG: hypothetical protein ACE5G8_12385, partial [Anaerolineae bacterium]